MSTMHRVPWSTPSHREVPELDGGEILACAPGEPWSHVVEIAHALGRGDEGVEISRFERRAARFVDGPLAGEVLDDRLDVRPLPRLLDAQRGVLCDDPLAIAEALAPQLFAAGETERRRVASIRTRLVDAVYALGRIEEQGRYEDAHASLAAAVETLDVELDERRFLGGDRPGISDVLLFAFSVRLDPVYYELYKASVGLLADFPSLEAHARDLYERPAFYTTTDFDEIREYHYLVEPTLNPRGLVPRGGLPDLDAPHFRAWRFGDGDRERAVGEDQDRSRASGEWVRPQSEERRWIRADGRGRYPAEAGRYHLYAPYNCPWSHRALLGRAIVGLDEVVGASIVYFRRDPERGWQFNPQIPGCTVDRAEGVDYIEELYERVGSAERSVPVLWDTQTETIVSNESADILRIFATEFEALAERDVELFPESHRDEIERLNAAVYQRINNGAYKAGFADGQLAYERAFARYFRALDWLEELLGRRRWLAGTERVTEADVRLFPTVFRHDAVYYARFRLNRRRISDYPRLSRWRERMMEVPGVCEASNLDHARNGYFGRTGNEIVPAGPVPLGLSRRDFTEAVWLAEGE
jgi:putative glutathione S-transferase